MSLTPTSDVSTLDSLSSRNKSVTGSTFAVSMDREGFIEYERMSVEDDSTEGSVAVSQSKILMELENGKLWQSFN